MKLYTVAILGATGAVGQEMMNILEERNFPVGKLVPLASARSAGKTYREAVGERWAFDWEIPANVADMVIMDASDIDAVGAKVDFVFCAVSMSKDETKALEERYAKAEIPVVSNNSAPVNPG